MDPATRTELVPAKQRSITTRTQDPAEVRFRTVRLADAPKIWELVADSGVLDANSRYCYLLLCRDFADTCVVACRDAEVVGFVTAYRPPNNPDTVFVWQIGIAASARRQGLARKLLRKLVSLPSCRDVRFLDATVTPSNTPSRRLFQSFAEELGVPCRVLEGFTAEMFGGAEHEEEQRFRIGPFSDSPKESQPP